MRRIITAITMLALATATASAVSAQGVRFGAGLTGLFGIGSNNSGSAFGGTGLVEFGGRIDHPLGFRVDGSVVHGSGVTSELATGDVVYNFHTPERLLHPYLLAGGGIQHSPGFTKPMAKGGAGFEYHMFHRNRGTVLFGEATFNLLFRGNGAGTGKALQANLGLKFGGH